MKTTLIWAPGTWEAENAEGNNECPAEDKGFGLGLWLVDWRFPNRLDPNRYRYRFLCPPGYKGSFGIIDGDGKKPEDSLKNPSYQESVAAGVEYAVGVVNRTPGPLVLGGYSQGAELISRLVQEFLSGRLRQRLGDVRAVVTYGNPCRAKGRIITGQPPLLYGGIAGELDGGPLLWYDYCFPQDMWGNANPDSYLPIGYQIFTRGQMHNPFDFVEWITKNLNVIYDEIGIQPDSLWWKVKNPIDAFKVAKRSANTLFQAEEFLRTGAHGHYHDQPLWEGGPVPIFDTISRLNTDIRL